MSDGPGPFEQMREMRARASFRAQRERALLLDVTEKSKVHLAVLTKALRGVLPVETYSSDVAGTMHALTLAILEYETWKAANS